MKTTKYNYSVISEEIGNISLEYDTEDKSLEIYDSTSTEGDMIIFNKDELIKLINFCKEIKINQL